ncbi:MAG: dTDP-4-dehydrorhamnose 3,5-epimerase [Pigmentiphaga sp.]|uniref:dTDP-4-dehydrorhamnose 3,5-epimerase n=1 Tax=Pigmentiphaga sp. TaxID=1977564 RepID=UPI0029A08534|nr:dTDP-4-dehydrorhamnose 3,5-epimerase [Pigmentiphaga sp.]MDX3906786.1 dTDP-4-dehydrorhamnose 3,5-epimerase [Pigmentiphaga sp.]
MNIIQTRLPGVLIFEPKVFGDDRGFFVETFRETWLEEARIPFRFVQDNQSRSRRGVLRGLHYQWSNPQGKLVRAARGKVFDVAVDVRKGSPSFGQWVGVELDDIHHRQLWIPPGFAHGFCVLSDEADFVYKCTTYYDPASDTGIRWDDKQIGIDWPDAGVPFQLSPKDTAMPALADQALDKLPRYEG